MRHTPHGHEYIDVAPASSPLQNTASREYGNPCLLLITRGCHQSERVRERKSAGTLEQVNALVVGVNALRDGLEWRPYFSMSE